MADTIRRVILTATPRDGEQLFFAELSNGSCAILRNGDRLYVGPGDKDGIATGVEVFLKLAHLDGHDGQKD